MERGSYRTPHSDRRVINRSEPSARQSGQSPSSSKPVSDEPRQVFRTTPQSKGSSGDASVSKRTFLTALIVVAVIILGLIGWMAWSSANRATAIDGSKYQAVLLTNGESYFGKLSALNDDFMRLTDIYYLKAKTVTDEGSESSAEDSFQLIKFGGEVQGPEDEILISKAQILYYENLKPDGKASQAIEQYKKSQ